ncbi:hypothetical protein, partial [Gordoniibacillus kamchatkensis]|uniref:hypothetical protein n=1 Tax=Gordoniibacillus kamchatkensis TaxID=1590651 RepID=UPI001E47A676
LKSVLWSTGAQVYSMIIIPVTIFIYGAFSKRGTAGYEKKIISIKFLLQSCFFPFFVGVGISMTSISELFL